MTSMRDDETWDEYSARVAADPASADLAADLVAGIAADLERRGVPRDAALNVAVSVKYFMNPAATAAAAKAFRIVLLSALPDNWQPEIIAWAVGPEGELDDTPVLVDPGWVRAVPIPAAGGVGYRVLFYGDGSARFEHRCDRGPRGVVICAPLLQLGGGHRIVAHDPLTIEPSILCSDCGTHGFVRAGRWTT